MSSYTTNLQLFKYNTATDGKQVFSIDDAMNDNWDKIDAFAKAIKDLSNLSSVGEKRFTDINNELSQKLEAQVSLAQNGYIKFNNRLIICWCSTNTSGTVNVTLPITYSNFFNGFCCYQNTDSGRQIFLYHLSVYNKSLNGFSIRVGDNSWQKAIICIGV